MPKSILYYTCRNEDCEHETELSVYYTPIVPAQTYGLPENCYPEEGGDFEIDQEVCPKCGTPIDFEKARESFFEQQDDRNI